MSEIRPQRERGRQVQQCQQQGLGPCVGKGRCAAASYGAAIMTHAGSCTGCLWTACTAFKAVEAVQVLERVYGHGRQPHHQHHAPLLKPKIAGLPNPTQEYARALTLFASASHCPTLRPAEVQAAVWDVPTQSIPISSLGCLWLEGGAVGGSGTISRMQLIQGRRPSLCQL